MRRDLNPRADALTSWDLDLGSDQRFSLSGREFKRKDLDSTWGSDAGTIHDRSFAVIRMRTDHLIWWRNPKTLLPSSPDFHLLDPDLPSTLITSGAPPPRLSTSNWLETRQRQRGCPNDTRVLKTSMDHSLSQKNLWHPLMYTIWTG